jgi:ubiquinone/menaquinone biosynthesis C-methylase UbiE
MTVTHRDPVYVLGRSDEETQRLQRQAQLYNPLTRRLLVAAGVGQGMRVLDVGSGAGDVALLAAELVGPTGEVVGIDLNGAILDVARRRAQALGWTNITFVEGDARTVEIAGVFDAVVGRFVLGYVRDPVTLLRASMARLRPGGLVVFQSHDVASFYEAVPPTPIVDTWRQWAERALGESGIRTRPRSYEFFCAAGLKCPQMCYEAPIGGGPDWIGYETLNDHARGLKRALLELGIATEAEMNIETLTERIRKHVVDTYGVFRCLPAVGIWARAIQTTA